VIVTELHPKSVLQTVNRRSTGRAIALNWNDCDRSNSEDVHMAPTSIIYGIRRSTCSICTGETVLQSNQQELSRSETLAYEQFQVFTHSAPSLSYLCNMSMELTAASSKGGPSSRVNSSRMTPIATEVSPSFEGSLPLLKQIPPYS
jgi:hypothetical protein